MIRRFLVAEHSMSPALSPGERVTARRVWRPHRGAIVFFPHPHRGGFWLVKRVVALAGERVTIGGGNVIVDGAPLAEPWTTDPTEGEGEWFLPRGTVFVLSDARGRSRADSRTFGPVPTKLMYTPLSRRSGEGR